MRICLRKMRVEYENNEGVFLHHTSCDSCGSSDGRAVYSNGTSYCFSCQTWHKDSSETSQNRYTTTNKKQTAMELIQDLEYKDLKTRKIPENICQQYRYSLGTDKNGVRCQVANYYDKDKQLVAQKLRYPDKTFKFIGKPKEAMMFGQQLFGNKGKKLTITEGEIDALAVATAFNGKYPVVSIKNGVQSAKKEIAQNLDYISSFEEVYLWFDNDEHGRRAIEEVVNLLPIDKVRIVRHPDYKDACEVLQKTGSSGVVNTFYNAESYKPDDIATPDDLLDEIAEPIEIGFPWYYKKLTEITFGRRYGEVVVAGAGVSVNY